VSQSFFQPVERTEDWTPTTKLSFRRQEEIGQGGDLATGICPDSCDEESEASIGSDLATAPQGTHKKVWVRGAARQTKGRARDD